MLSLNCLKNCFRMFGIRFSGMRIVSSEKFVVVMVENIFELLSSIFCSGE